MIAFGGATMTNYQIQNDDFKNYTGSSTFLFLLENGDTFTLDEGFTVSTASLTKYLVTGFESNNTVTIAGTLDAASFTLSLGDNGKSGNDITVTATGSVISQGTAIGLWGSSSTISNDGLISGTAEGISKEYGVLGKAFTITNGASGVITSQEDAIVIGSTVREKTIVNNDGTISGVTSFYGKSSAVAEIHNNGTMYGDILFGSGNDVYDGNDGSISGTIIGGAGRDTLTGGGKKDLFFGGAGRDILTGKGGADEFIYEATADSTGAKTAFDLIGGFSRSQRDMIDVEFIDANTTKGDDQDFTFIGASAKAGTTGQLWYQIEGNTTYLYGNTDRDSVAEFGLALSGKVKLVAGDFDL